MLKISQNIIKSKFNKAELDKLLKNGEKSLSLLRSSRNNFNISSRNFKSQKRKSLITKALDGYRDQEKKLVDLINLLTKERIKLD